MQDIDKSNTLFWSYLILTPVVGVLGMYFCKWKYYNHFQCIQVFLTIIFCIIAMFEDSEPHYLLGMTTLQEVIVFTTGISYVYETSEFIVGYIESNKKDGLRTEIMHHLPAYIGVCYMLYVKQCGGIIVRLLLDCVDYFLYFIDILTEQKYEQLISDLQEVAFFILRACWYSVLSVYGIVVMIQFWSFIDKFLFVIYCIWTVYVLYDHLYHSFWLYDRFELIDLCKRRYKQLINHFNHVKSQ